MIIELSVRNVLSFKEMVTLSMVAAKIHSKKEELDTNNVIVIDEDLSLLKSAAIYGANASGKSNLIACIRFMQDFVRSSSRETQIRDEIDVENFRLSSETEKKPSFFEMVFLLNGIKYRYGFEITKQSVIAEWLYYVPTIREVKLFEREGDHFQLGSSFKEGRGLGKRTRNNALFLSVLAQFNGEISKSIVEWFIGLEVSVGLSDTIDQIRAFAKFEDEKYQKDIVEFVKQLDVGVEDMRLEKSKIDLPRIPSGLNSEMQRVLEILQEQGEGEEVLVRTSHRKYGSQGQFESFVFFDLEKHESEGTKKIFALAYPILQSLRNGGIIIIDELDARLHPLVTREIIKLFNSKTTNPNNAQLIFTTHDTNLLSNELFRRDQIWFTEKSGDGSTHLYSLVEYKDSKNDSKVRNDAALEKNYIQGRYGGIPFIGDFRKLIGVEDA